MQNTKDKFWAPERAPTFWVNQASRLLTWHFEQQLRPLDVGMAYLPVLMALEQSEDGALLQKQLAELARVEQPTMAALLVRMERDGLIEREVSPTDKRATHLSLSEKARQCLPLVKQQILLVAEQATTGFTDGERETLVLLLQRMVNNLDSNS